MSAYTTKAPIPAVDLTVVPEDAVQIAYWRKHPSLHGWMEQLYRSEGGTAEIFNCVPMRIDAEDLDALERALDESGLPETTGLFFGVTCPEDIALDRAFIAAVRAALAAGAFVFYDSWW
ncbi:hypothetical protein [Variovorax paradoxus]|uniref:hypothetical protein n=1 Tax=Variovorax paradoxus TaxID=34073 RepID=UPI00247B289E